MSPSVSQQQLSCAPSVSHSLFICWCFLCTDMFQNLIRSQMTSKIIRSDGLEGGFHYFCWLLLPIPSTPREESTLPHACGFVLLVEDPPALLTAPIIPCCDAEDHLSFVVTRMFKCLIRCWHIFQVFFFFLPSRSPSPTHATCPRGDFNLIEFLTPQTSPSPPPPPPVSQQLLNVVSICYQYRRR